MSDTDEQLSIAAREALSELIRILPDDDRFGSIADLAWKFRSDAATLREGDLQNAIAPALQFYPPRDRPPEGEVQFVYHNENSSAVPSNDNDLAYLPVSRLAPLIRDRKVSPVELTELYLSRLDSQREDLCCVVTMTCDLALRQAKQVEEEIADGRYRGPLHGIPWGAKDLLATKGFPTTWGATPYREQVFDYDSAVVERLTEAGAILVAKLSMGALAYGPHWFGGMTRNPWNTETGASGSSAGPGAATAAGLVGFSIGTETHGSITSPSHTCGVTGLRPTFGSVSRFGAMALAWSMDKIGPMCRSAEDCAAVFSAISGRDDRDATTCSTAFAWPNRRALSEIRVGFVEAEYDAVEDEAARSVDDHSLRVLREIFGELKPVTLPECPAGLMLILWVEAAAAFDDLARTEDLDSLHEQDNSQWPKIFRAARSIPATDYVRAQRIRSQVAIAFDHLMQDYDVIVVPAMGSTSLTISNMSGHPALTLPAGFVEGMPRGMTLIGKLWDESTLLAVGHAFQSATEWHLKRPALGSP